MEEETGKIIYEIVRNTNFKVRRSPLAMAYEKFKILFLC
jgi:hypothetical protein